MRVLLISTYELGHQPLHVASPAAALRRAGHEVRCLDLSVQPWDPDALDWAQAVGFSVPMHTAMRVAGELRWFAESELIGSGLRDRPRHRIGRRLQRLRAHLTVLRPRGPDEAATPAGGDRGDRDHAVERSARADRDERPRRTRLPGFARGRSPAESKRIGRRCAVSSLGGRPTEQSSGVDKAACGRGLGSRDSCGAPLWISMQRRTCHAQ